MPKMPSPIPDRMQLLRNLDKVYQRLCDNHCKEMRAIGNRVPIGGAGWMDLFFRMEGIRGVMTAVRAGKTLPRAIENGKEASEVAVRLWNSRREYQVHRWEKTVHDFIDRTVKECL